ncbi:MAG TPA: thiamine pyrophosphate-dependent enzyme [Candidatus Limnocylindrales bacterium]|nr:thiamine pyrophosphate-dependent enzyme [Candidatus Limnocylindrales bacterium]
MVDEAATTETAPTDSGAAAATDSTAASAASEPLPPEPATETMSLDEAIDGSSARIESSDESVSSAREASEIPTPETDAPESSETRGAEASESVGPRTVGRFIADALRAAGVRYAFTVPGESFLGLLEGLHAAGIRVVATRHEGAAAFMAEAHGQLTGRPAVALGTRAVGAANLAIGIHTARQDSTPMFVLVGQVDRPLRGREAFQEIDQATTIGGLAAHAHELAAIDDLPTVLGDAVRAAIGGRPGPAFLAIPEDLIDEIVPAGTALDQSRPAPRRPEPDEIRAAIQLVATARRPVILAGAGVLRARTSTELVRFAELLRVPVIASWRRADVIPNDHPLYLGMAGFGAPAVVRERLESADALLVIGCRLNEITTSGYRIPAAGRRWMHVDVEPLTDGPARPAPVATIRADARAFLRAAVARLQQGVLDAESADARAAANDVDRAAWESATAVAETSWPGPGVHPAAAVAIARRVLPDDAIIATDAGNFGLWIARHFRFRRPGTFLGPTSGAMGYGLPAAIAAALVHRDRTVVAFAGDGGFAMTMAELETAVREHAKVIAVVFDNERYGTIRMYQDRRDGEPGDRVIATDLGPVDFAAVARGLGARGIRVETDAAFEQALRQAMANDRATVIQVALDRGWVHPDEPYQPAG